MFRKLVIGALGAMAVLFSTMAFAQGTAADAKAMLEKTVAAIKADKAKTLDQINKGENGFVPNSDAHAMLFSPVTGQFRCPSLRMGGLPSRLVSFDIRLGSSTAASVSDGRGRFTPVSGHEGRRGVAAEPALRFCS
jgi:hypothetical protein